MNQPSLLDIDLSKFKKTHVEFPKAPATVVESLTELAQKVKGGKTHDK